MSSPGGNRGGDGGRDGGGWGIGGLGKVLGPCWKGDGSMGGGALWLIV